MQNLLELALVLLILSNLLLLGSGRLLGCIRYMAAQGALLAVLPFLVAPEAPGRAAALGAGALVLRALVFPALLRRALREVAVRREVEPLIGYGASLLLGVLALGLSFRLGARLPLPMAGASDLIVPAGLFTLFSGLFLIVSRRKAITQVVGYIVLENGIHTLGLVLTGHTPLLVELGVALDVFAGVFIMGIFVFHIGREFDHLDTDRLSALRDGP